MLFSYVGEFLCEICICCVFFTLIGNKIDEKALCLKPDFHLCFTDSTYNVRPRWGHYNLLLSDLLR